MAREDLVKLIGIISAEDHGTAHFLADTVPPRGLQNDSLTDPRKHGEDKVPSHLVVWPAHRIPVSVGRSADQATSAVVRKFRETEAQ